MRWIISLKVRRLLVACTTLLLLGAPFASFAHEAYVLTPQEFSRGLRVQSFDALRALATPGNLRIALLVGLGVAIAYVLAVLFRLSPLGQRAYRALGATNTFGPLFVRAAISASLFYSALTWSF